MEVFASNCPLFFNVDEDKVSIRAYLYASFLGINPQYLSGVYCGSFHESCEAQCSLIDLSEEKGKHSLYSWDPRGEAQIFL